MRYTCLFVLLFVFCKIANAQLRADLKPGRYKTGFKVLRETAANGKLFLVNIWYPAKKEGKPLTLGNYIETGIINGKEDKQVFLNEFKHTLELPFLFGIKPISPAVYKKIISTTANATLDAEMENGKWPLVIEDTEPVSLCVTNEWLAGNGFIVAAPVTDMPPPADDHVLYDAPTDALDFLLSYMTGKNYIDTANISALGFGGGGLASFYLSMRTHKIKSFVNIEGGLFQPLSKTTLSKNYQPGKFTVPLLHVVRQETMNGENAAEFDAIKAPKFRVTIIPATIQHHDFTIYGRVVNGLLHERGNNAAMASLAFTALHQVILYFLQHRNMDDNVITQRQLFRLQKF